RYGLGSYRRPARSWTPWTSSPITKARNRTKGRIRSSRCRLNRLEGQDECSRYPAVATPGGVVDRDLRASGLRAVLHDRRVWSGEVVHRGDADPQLGGQVPELRGERWGR